MSMTENKTIEKSSGNVFADLGFEEPATELAKADLAHAISRIIDMHGWTQEEAARQMAIDQPKVSAIVRGRLVGFSFDRLLRMLNQMNYAVDVTLRQVDSEETAGIDVKLAETGSSSMVPA